MEKSFKEMDFEWEFLHPKGPLLADEHQLNLNCLSSHAQVMEEDHSMNQPLDPIQLVPIADEELSDDPAMGTEEICQEVTDEDADFEESMAFEAGDEEGGELWKIVECNSDNCNASSLKKWLRSIGVAAATLSIFMLGGGRAQLIGNNQKIQLPICTKVEKIKDSVQHKGATSPSFSWCGHYDERF